MLTIQLSQEMRYRVENKECLYGPDCLELSEKIPKIIFFCQKLITLKTYLSVF